MKIPDLLEFAIEEEVNKHSIKDLKNAALNLSKRYMESERTGETFLRTNLDTIAYSVIRMPATYSAIRTCLEKVLEVYDFDIKSVLDIGSGTGAAEWVCNDLFDVNDIVCLEREKDMRDISKKYFSFDENLKNVKFIESDILKEDLSVKKDLCILSYIINELSIENRLKVIDKVLKSAGKVLLIVEPGTPEGFNNIKEIRDYAYNKGYKIIARNFSCKYGELDIVAQKGDMIVIIEVKTRKNDNYAQAKEFVDYRKQNRIRNTADLFLQQQGLTDKIIRFDVAEVYTDNDTVNITEDAFS